MNINPLYVIACFMGLGLTVFLYTKGRALVEQVKIILFTPASVFVALMYAAMAVGVVSCWIFVNVQILGSDVSMSLPSETAMRGKVK